MPRGRPPLRKQLIVLVGGLLAATGVAAVLAHGQSGLGADLPAAEGESSCAGPRWPVKTMADPGPTSVDLGRVQETTVAALRRQEFTQVDRDTARVPGTETTLVRVTADLVSGRVSPDGDLAVVVSAPGSHGQTMTVEFPDPSCLGSRTPAAARAASVSSRGAFERACGRFGTSKTALSGTTTLTGVRFLDTPHKLKNGVNARQAAPNEIELHPVLAVGSLTCQRPSGHSSAPSAGRALVLGAVSP